MKKLRFVVGIIVMIAAVVFIGAAIWTWLIMLAAGSLGYALGFWTLFPVGLLLGCIVSGISGNNRRK